MVRILEHILWAPVIAAVLAIAAIGVIHAWRFLKFTLSQK